VRAAARNTNGALLFSLTGADSPVLPMKNLIGARLWIHPGGQPLPADDLSFAVVGSDKQPYWSRDEQSAPQQDVPYAGETRLGFLGLRGDLPANTWTLVEAWFNRLQYAPATRYLTGIYLKSDRRPQVSFYVDDVALIGVPDAAPPAIARAASQDLSSVDVFFSEEVDARAAGDAQRYRISSRDDPAYQSPQAPAEARYDAATASARLTPPQPLKPNMAYIVQAEGIADLAFPPNLLAGGAPVDFTASALIVTVDARERVHPISPFIYGVSGAPKEYLDALKPTLNNWGGNPSTRYNWLLGNAWNAGRDWEYRNGDYGYRGAAAHDDFVSETLSSGAAVRYTLPTLGWVAKNNDNNTCSFPTADGKCSNLSGANCEKPADIADPNRANVPSTSQDAARLVRHFVDEKGFAIEVLGMDNEPELWGYTHYDVHPGCTTYDEARDKYIEYATAARQAAPGAKLSGPSTCCWHYYWNSAAGLGDKLAHGNQDFLPWFLDQMRAHDEQAQARTLDMLDIHFYPAGVYNDNTDPQTALTRLHMTRSLWDPDYVDESWINQPIYLIPRMKQLIAEHYPGTLLSISEWNWGAEKTPNGALAIADVLGVFGREGLDYATYWRYPPLGSPGFFAFRLYTNYDGAGGRFGDTSVMADSSDQDRVSAYASLDSQGGRLFLMLLNKDPLNAARPTVRLSNFTAAGGRMYRTSQANAGDIVSEPFAWPEGGAVDLPPYSITLLVMEPA
jgi:hypothetical protein